MLWKMGNISSSISGIQTPASSQAKAFAPRVSLFVNAAELRELLGGISRTTLHNWTSPSSVYFQPNFPQPIQLSERCKIWERSAVLTWIEQCKANGKRPGSRAARQNSNQSAHRAANVLRKEAK